MSLTISSLVVMILGIFLKGAGFELAPEEIQEFIAVLLQFVGAVGVYWGRYRAGDLKWFGGRK